MLKLKPLLTELAECFLKEYLQYFYDVFDRTFKLKISLNLKPYYNSRFNEKIIKSFKEVLKYYQTYFIYTCLYSIYMINTNLLKKFFNSLEKHNIIEVDKILKSVFSSQK